MTDTQPPVDHSKIPKKEPIMRTTRVASKGGRMISVEIVVLIATALISAAGGYFASRAAMNDRISKLEAQYSRQVPITYRQAEAQFYKQAAHLRVLEEYADDLHDHLLSWKKPSFVYQKGRSPMLPEFFPMEDTFEWFSLADQTNISMARGLDLRILNHIVLSPGFGGISDTDLSATLYRISLLANEYNSLLASIQPAIMIPSPPGDPTKPPVIPEYASRDDVERFFESAENIVLRLAGMTDGLASRLQSARIQLEESLEISSPDVRTTRGGQ